MPNNIQAVHTSITAFVGRAAAGPTHEPVNITSHSAYQRIFGGLSVDSAMSFMVQDFFENGGTQAVILRLKAPEKRFFVCRWLQPKESAALQTSDYIGTEQSGLYALHKAGDFSLLCLPEETTGGIPPEVISAAAQMCEQRRAFLLLDPPPGWTSPQAAAAGAGQTGTDSANAAVFFPRLVRPNPLKGGSSAAFGPCGAVAGIFARLDAIQGVWKAPAGTEAAFAGAPELSIALTRQDMDLLNPLGINALRALPDGSRVIWGSRTLASTTPTSEWKYISVRRTVLFIEESIAQGIQWAASEPNGEPLWIQLRQVIEDFLFQLWQKGAFPGNKPEAAYFVRCGRDTMTQADLDAGRVIIMIGLALTKPAEFTIIRLAQSAKT
jgi:phage tail sheath protein FI